MRAIWVVTLVMVPGMAMAQAQQEKKTVEGTATEIVEQPLKDLNIEKPKIPPALTAIQKEPYSTAGLKTCHDYANAIAEMNAVLGPDVDSPQAKAKGDSASDFALGAAKDMAGGLIPGSGLIRKVSGAEKEARKAAAAIYAGGLRRAYLKGAAHTKGCKI